PPARPSPPRPICAARPDPPTHPRPPPRPHPHPRHPSRPSDRRPAARPARRTPRSRHHHRRDTVAGRLCPTTARRPALDGPHPGRGRRLWPEQRRQLPATPAPTSLGARPTPRPNLGLRDAALGYASRGIPVLPLHYPLPHRGDLQALTSDQQLASPA